MWIHFICMRPSWTCFHLWHKWHSSCQLTQFLEYSLNLNSLRQLTTVHSIHMFYWLQLFEFVMKSFIWCFQLCLHLMKCPDTKEVILFPHQTPISFHLCMQPLLDRNAPTATVPSPALKWGVCCTRSALCCQVFFPSGLTGCYSNHKALVCLFVAKLRSGYDGWSYLH